MCPFSCDKCPTLIPVDDGGTNMDSSPTACVDNKYFSVAGDREKTCFWVGKNKERRQQFCSEESVRDHCPRACGVCCKDDDQYRFGTTQGLKKTCKWLSKEKKRQNKYCHVIIDDSAVQTSCPQACGICGEEPCSEEIDLGKGSKSTKAPETNSAGKGVKGTKYPKAGSKAPGKEGGKTTKNPKAGSKAPGKGGRPSLSPTQSTISPGKGTYGTKMPKNVSKGKTNKCTKTPGKGSKATTSPTLLPSASPTSDDSVVFSVEVCYQGCGNLPEVEGADVLKEKVLLYAFDSVTPGDASVTITSPPESDCSPCEFVNERKRFLQNNDGAFLKSNIVFEVTVAEKGTIIDATVINNLNSARSQLNEELQNEDAAFQLVGAIEDATSQEPSLSPTRSPVFSPTDPPSSPPQELSTRRIAERMNQYYMTSQHMQKIQEPGNMLEIPEHSSFDEFEDLLTHSNIELLTYNSTSASGTGIGSMNGNEDDYVDIPDYVDHQNDTDHLQCKCVDCDEDVVCGGLWKGSRYPGVDESKTKNIHL